jgi:GNAT superfamily N-acetyltransferase
VVTRYNCADMTRTPDTPTSGDQTRADANPRDGNALRGVTGADRVQLRDPAPGDLGWVVQRHGEIYRAEWGWNLEFEILVAQIMGRYRQGAEGARDRGWIAWLDGRRVGCIFLMAGETPDAGKLRLFLVEPGARGKGVGDLLMRACIEGAIEAGYTRLQLWTNARLQSAAHLYARYGFQVIARESRFAFGFEQPEEVWALDLGEPASAPVDAAPDNGQ